MKRLTDHLIESLHASLIDIIWHSGLEEEDIKNGVAGVDRAFAELRRYKEQLEVIAERTCPHDNVQEGKTCLNVWGLEPRLEWCYPCRARYALSHDE